MAEIYSLRPSEHETVQQLLPWHVNGTLDADESARVETHLGECAECRDDLAAERALAHDIALLPLDVEDGWAGMAMRIGGADETGGRRAWPQGLRTARTGWVVGGAIAASFALALVIAQPWQSSAPDRTFHTLGSPGAVMDGQAIVLFRPDTTAQQMRAVLMAHGAKVVDGPTAAGGYVLHFDGDAATAIAGLRGSDQVVLAEPLSGDGRP